VRASVSSFGSSPGGQFSSIYWHTKG
jgi:hypothetical protein